MSPAAHPRPAGSSHGAGKRVSSRVTRKRERKSGEILQAAARVLGDRGYAGTSLDEIAKRLDVAKATLYHYFPSKDALVGACLRQPSSAVIDRLEEVATAHPDPRARLRALIVADLRMITLEHRDTARLFMRPIDLPEPLQSELRAIRERHDRPFRAAIQEGIDAGVFDPAAAAAARQCMHGALNYAPVWVHGATTAVHRTLEAVADTVMRLFLPDASFRPDASSRSDATRR